MSALSHDAARTTDSQEASPPEASLPVAKTPEPSSAGLMARLGRWWDRDRMHTAAELRALYAARLTDTSANRTAKEWCAQYIAAGGKGRRTLLTQLVEAGASLEPRSDQGLHLFRRLNAQTGNLQLMVDLRADMLRWHNQIAGLIVLERELEALLSNWFDVGMLELKPITWDSPASLLEKLIQFEAVHEIRSWEELKHRVADNRRCYAFFHPRMSDVPLIFVEVAFAHQMADNVQVLLDPQTPAESLSKARWAIFYSISNTQPGLRGISFGNFLLKRVIEELLRETPRLKFFATLSPIPGFADWLKKQDSQVLQALLHHRTETETHTGSQAGARWAAKLQEAAVGNTPELVQNAALKLAAHYLTTLKNGRPIDPVARFHLGNGARMERVNWAADRSAKGLEQSCSLMVNYLYDLDELDQNLAQLAAGKPNLGRNLKRLL